MAAEYEPRTAPEPLPLILPPDKPPVGVFRTFGWRWRPGTDCRVLDRRPQDDAHGALVQWIVLRYYRDGVFRHQLAAEYGYSERAVQEYLSGQRGRNGAAGWWLAYSAPVIRALTRLGIPNLETRCNQRKRLDAQTTALRGALAGVVDLLADDDRPAARRLREDIRLLTVELP